MKANERDEVTGVSGDRAVVWACGRTVELGTPPGTAPVDSNDRGQVLSTSSGYGGDRRFVSTPT